MTTIINSFMNGLLDERTTEPTNERYTSTKKANPASPGQIKFYHDLCVQKGETPQPVETFTFDTMSAEIDRLVKISKPSPAQVTLIKDKVVALNKLGTKLELNRAAYLKILPKELPEDLLNKFNEYIYNNAMALPIVMTGRDVKQLSGGRGGTASMLIELLINLEKAQADNMPAEEAQVNLILSMFLFPDADFENYGISRRIDVDVDNGLWRKPTPEEFAAMIKDNMSKATANEFLNKHQAGFYEWKKTRIRPEQLRYIMNLERQLGDDSRLSKIDQAVMQDGSVVDLGSQDRENISGTAYVLHTEEQLIQFTVEQASQFIDQLKAEVARKSEFSIIDEYQDYDLMRTPQNENEAISIEFKEFESIMFTLEAIAGYEDVELHHAANYNLVADDSPESQVENRTKIRSFIKDMIEQGDITYYTVMELATNSVTLQRILLDM